MLLKLVKLIVVGLSKLVFKVFPIRYIALIFALVTISRVLEKRGSRLKGSLLGVPYDLRSPTRDRILERVWNPQDPRIITPHAYGMGWSLNLYSLARRLSKHLN